MATGMSYRSSAGSAGMREGFSRSSRERGRRSIGLGGWIQRSIVHYQPIVDLNSGRVLGAEALLRFLEPDGSLRGPSGLIEQIEASPPDLEAFLRRQFRLIARDGGPLLDRHPELYVSINVPPAVMASPRIRRIFDDSGLQRYMSRLVCEVTERQALTDAGRQALASARPLGLRVAMDDFGTGHSGLKHLIGLPLDMLKIDKSEITPLMHDPTADRLLRGLVALAAALRVRVVAEGVETREQAFFLQAAGVDAGQGWLWSRAVPLGELERLVRTGFPPPRVGHGG